jgi:hypothetical protein
LADDSLLFPGRSPRLWLRLEQHDDKAFYANVPEVGDGLILNANLAETSAASCASFIDKMARPFAFDPVSYRFGVAEWLLQDRGAGDEKRNYGRLWKKNSHGVGAWTGEPLRDSAVAASLTPIDLAKYARNVLDYQDCQLRHAWVAEAEAFVGMDPLFGSFAPAMYTAPYIIQTRDGGDSTSNAAAKLARLTAELGAPRSVIAVVALEAELLDDADRIADIAKRFAVTGIRAAWIWTVGMAAMALADRPGRFTNYLRLVRTLSDAGIEVGVMYGGYLAALLRFMGVRAISHGLMYGEVRGSLPAGGGPLPNFYWPPLHRFITYERARGLAGSMSRSEFLERICSCDVCSALVSEDDGLDKYFQATRPGKATRDFPVRSSLELNRFHFLLARGREIEELRSRGFAELVDQLLRAVDEFGDPAREPLRAWISRLESA